MFLIIKTMWEFIVFILMFLLANIILFLVAFLCLFLYIFYSVLDMKNILKRQDKCRAISH